MFKGTLTKWPVQKLTQGTTQKLLQHHDATDKQFLLFVRKHGNVLFTNGCNADRSRTRIANVRNVVEMRTYILRNLLNCAFLQKKSFFLYYLNIHG